MEHARGYGAPGGGTLGAGVEDLTAEDTLDGDYGRLLDRAYEKCEVLASPTGPEAFLPLTFA